MATSYLINNNGTVGWSTDAGTFIITYNLDGGTNNPSNPTTFTSDDLPLTLLNPTKTGYNFNSWSLNPIPSGTMHDVTETASWSLIAPPTYAVNLHDHFGIVDIYELMEFIRNQSLAIYGAWPSGAIGSYLYLNNGSASNNTDNHKYILVGINSYNNGLNYGNYLVFHKYNISELMYWNDTNTNAGGYQASTIRTACEENSKYLMIGQGLNLNCLKSITRYEQPTYNATSGAVARTRQIFVPTLNEIGLSTYIHNSDSTNPDASTIAWPYYSSNSSRVKTGTTTAWWTASCSSLGLPYACSVYPTGSGTEYEAGSSFGICPAFVIG